MSQSTPKPAQAPTARQGGADGPTTTTVTTTKDGKVVITTDEVQGPVVAPEAPTGITTIPPQLPYDPNAGPPPGAVTMTIALFITIAVCVIGLPLARAYARRMDRSHALPDKADPEMAQRLARMEQAVDSIAIEVERISEGQRFTTKLLSERGDAMPAQQRIGQG
jgi:hypothetical protein